MTASALIALAGLLALAYLPLTVSAPSVPRSLLKTASVALLAVTALVYGGPWGLVGALAFGAIGDWFLSRSGQAAFLTGLIAFALGHLLYILLLAGSADLAAPGPAALGPLALAAVMGPILWPRVGDLRLPVMGYIGLITAMGLVALSVAGSLPRAALAALLFILSDLLLSIQLFLLPERHPLSRPIGWLLWGLYWSAQALFLSAFLLPSGGEAH